MTLSYPQTHKPSSKRSSNMITVSHEAPFEGGQVQCGDILSHWLKAENAARVQASVKGCGDDALGSTIYSQSILISMEPNQTKHLPPTSSDILKDAAQGTWEASN